MPAMPLPTPPTSHRAVVVERPSWLQRHVEHVLSVALGLGAFVIGWAYRSPALTRPVPRPGARVYSLVQYIDQAGPYWIIGFIVVGVALLAVPVRPRSIGDLVHGAAAGVHGMFATAAWIGFALSDPPPTILAALLATLVTLTHVALAIMYGRPTGTGG